MRTYLFELHWHLMIIHSGKNAFEQWAESLLCDECFINEDMLAGSLNKYGSYVVSAGTNMHYIQ